MANICLILEGTYPYVTGGVSNWVHMLISGMPEYNFSIAHIYAGDQDEPCGGKYQVPENVSSVVNMPLSVNDANLTLQPLIQRIPRADIYHALSTGFAGLLGTEIKRETGAPFILTEHGIYWHEIELGATEVECGFKVVRNGGCHVSSGRTMQTWLNAFKKFARYAYQYADEITTVCRANWEKQLLLEADNCKCSVIPNGIEANKFAKKNHGTCSHTPKNIGLVGRVTSIKDVETFIKSCAIAGRKLPEARFWVIGPSDQDPCYYQKCKALAEDLNLKNLVFTGEVNTSDYYELLDILVLTSKSEGQPFVMLEAMAAGIPVVATDVGGCRDVVFGYGDDFGNAGIICSVEDAPGIAGAMIELYTNSQLWRDCSRAGQKRVNAIYRSDLFLEQYRSLYGKYLTTEGHGELERNSWRD